jgi:mannose-6-phosphate isomerase-like protein (cupin superfamily)
MEKTRVARFKELKPTKQAFVDTQIPGYEREALLVIGRGVTEDPSLQAAISDARDFNIAIIKQAPGKRVGLHDHPTVEVFMPLSGRWTVYWGDRGENEIVLEQWDTISIPPGVMRCFTNVGREDAYLLGITGGSDSGHVFWAPEVLEQAKATGLALDEHGNLITASQK